MVKRPVGKPVMAPSQRAGRTGALVYSTDSGRMCPDCRQPVARCVCRQAPALAKGDGIVRVSLEKKGRGGKIVTLARGLPLEPLALAAVARRLKTECGSGGTVSEGVVEIQGDHALRVMQSLQAQGYTVKRAGG